MFSKLKNGICIGLKRARKKVALFLAMGTLAITTTSAHAADIVSIDDSTGAMSFDIGPLISDLKSIFAGVVNNSLELFVLGLGVFLVVKLVKKLTNKAA